MDFLVAQSSHDVEVIGQRDFVLQIEASRVLPRVSQIVLGHRVGPRHARMNRVGEADQRRAPKRRVQAVIARAQSIEIAAEQQCMLGAEEIEMSDDVDIGRKRRLPSPQSQR